MFCRPWIDWCCSGFHCFCRTNTVPFHCAVAIVYSFCPNFEQCTYYFGKKRVWHWKVTAAFLQWARQKSFEQNFFTNEMKCNQHLSVSLSFFLILPRYWIFVCAWVFLMDFLTFCIFIVQPNQFERLSIHAFCICVVISFLYEQIISDQSRKMKKTHRTCAQSNSYYYCLIKKKEQKGITNKLTSTTKRSHEKRNRPQRTTNAKNKYIHSLFLCQNQPNWMNYLEHKDLLLTKLCRLNCIHISPYRDRYVYWTIQPSHLKLHNSCVQRNLKIFASHKRSQRHLLACTHNAYAFVHTKKQRR